MKSLLAIVVAAGLLALTACHSASPAPVADRPALTDGVTRASLDWLPLTARVAPIIYTEGQRQRQRKEVVITPVDQGLWKEVEPGVHVSYMRHDRGNLVVTRDEEAGDNVAVMYDPPLVLLSGDLELGKPMRLQTRMTVLNLATSAQREAGLCRYTLEFLGRQKFDTPVGTFDAFVVRSVRHIDLSLAKVDVTLTIGYVPGVGVVYSRIEQTTKALGLFGGRKIDESRLTR